MIKMREPIARDDKLWQGHPDVAFFDDEVWIVYRESDRHLTNGVTRIKLISGRMTEHNTLRYTNEVTLAESTNRLNCPRISVVDDRLWIVCDEIQSDSGFISAENDRTKTHVIIWEIRTEHGITWGGPIHTNIRGIVPDRLRKFKGKYFIAVHTKEHGQTTDDNDNDKDFADSYSREQKNGRLVQKIWTSDDPTDKWKEFIIVDKKYHNFCEASIFEQDNELHCLMRENSGEGKPAYYKYSDDGIYWNTGLFETRLFGCHRPVWEQLKSGNILVTYREQSSIMSPRCWARNTFAALIPKTTQENKENRYYYPFGTINRSEVNILPLDHDRSNKPDGGYTGWTQLPDERIFVVNYITDDAPKPYICGYLLQESDFEMNQ